MNRFELRIFRGLSFQIKSATYILNIHLVSGYLMSVGIGQTKYEDSQVVRYRGFYRWM